MGCALLSVNFKSETLLLIFLEALSTPCTFLVLTVIVGVPSGIPVLPKEHLSVQFSRSVVSDSLQPHELQHALPPCPSPGGKGLSGTEISPFTTPCF